MAGAKKNEKPAKGKGKAEEKKDGEGSGAAKGKGKAAAGGKQKAANLINVRHILVSGCHPFVLFHSMLPCSGSY